MLRKVLWIAAACAAVLLALWVSRGLYFDRAKPKPATAPPPPVVAGPAPMLTPSAPPQPLPPVAAKPPRTAEEEQVQDDAAATGMTTLEPQEAPAGEEPPT